MALAKQLENIQTRGEYVYQRLKAPPSILFDNKVSRKLDTEQILHLAVEGLETLRNLDQRFCRFEHTIFSLLHPVDRNMRNDEENRGIDKEIREFCSLASPYFLLRATHKCLEWLIRGLEAGKRNVDDLIALALPFHATPQFIRLLSVCELEATRWAFLKPVGQHKEPLQRNTLRQQAPLWLWRFVTQTAKDCAERSVRASPLYSFWAVFVREKLQTTGEKDNTVMKDILLDTLLGIQMRQGDWDSLLEYRNASVVVLCSFFQSFKLNAEMVSACVNALCCSFDSVLSLQNMTRAVYSSEENMFYPLSKSLLKCLMLLFFYQCDIEKEDEYFVLSAENIAQLYKDENIIGRILRELLEEVGTEYSYPFMMIVSISMMEQLSMNVDWVEAAYQLISLTPTKESLRFLIRKLLNSFERQLELCLKQVDDSQDRNDTLPPSSYIESQSHILQRLQKVMNRLKTMGHTEELDWGIREYLQHSKNETIREQIVEVLVGVFSGSMILPVVIHCKDVDSYKGKETIVETLLGVLEHPEATIREYALKMLRQRLLESMRTEEEHPNEKVLRYISETLIRRVDMEDCHQVFTSVLELFREFVDLQSSVQTLLFWSIERRLERMWNQVEDMDKQMIIQLLQKLPLLQIDEEEHAIPFLANFLSIVLHPEIELEVKQVALNSFVTLWGKIGHKDANNNMAEKTNDDERNNPVSLLVALLTSWLTSNHPYNKESLGLVLSIVELVMKDCLDVLSYEKRQPLQSKMIFRQLLFISVILNIILYILPEDERDTDLWVEKIYSLIECVVESIGTWILSGELHSSNKRLNSTLLESAWNDKTNWLKPIFLQKLFSIQADNSSVLLFFGGMCLLKQFYQKMDVEWTTPMKKRTQLLATLLFPLENCKWHWTSLDRKMIEECILQLSKSSMEENVIHLLLDNEFHCPPVWIALYFLIQEKSNMDSLTVAALFVLYQQLPWARPAVENAYKYLLNNRRDSKAELLHLLVKTLQVSSSLLVNPMLPNDVKVAMLQSSLDMKYLSNFHIQLVTLLAPVDDQQKVSLELLETVVKFLQIWENHSDRKEEWQDIYLVIASYFTFIEDKDLQVAKERDDMWNVFINRITTANENKTQVIVAFLKRWPFVVSFGSPQRWKDLAHILFQLWNDRNQEDIIVLQARQLLMKLAELDISLFLTQLEQLVKVSLSVTREELPLLISHSIPVLEIFANVDVDVVNDEEDLSHLVKSLTIYLPVLSNNLENQSSLFSYAQGLVVSILYRLCKYFGKRFPVGSLNLKVFTQDDEHSYEGALSRSALIRLICYLTQLFPCDMKKNFINALKWMLKMTSAEYVVRNISHITPAIIAILSQQDEDMITIPFISELLTFLDAESRLSLAKNIFDSLGHSKLEAILFSYLTRDTKRKWMESGDRNISTFWESYKALLFSFPLAIQLQVVEQFLQSMENSSEEDIYLLSLELVRCMTQSPMFRSWQGNDAVLSKELDPDKLAACLITRTFLSSVKSQERMQVFQEQYAPVVFCLFPFSIVVGAMKTLLKMESNTLRYLVMNCITQLLYKEELPVTKHATWYGTVERIKQTICVELLVDILENVTSWQGKDSQLFIASMAALDVCIQIHPRENLLTKLSPAIQPCMEYCCHKKKNLASSSMLCLSTIVRKLGISCVEYVPHLLQVITTVWEQSCRIANSRKQNVKQQTYIRAVIILVSSFQQHLSAFWSIPCVHSMLKCCPSSGKNAFAQQLMDQLEMIMSHLGVYIAMPVLNMALEEMVLERMHFLLCCMEKWLDNISNKDFCSHQHDIFSSLLKALDIRRVSMENGLLLDDKEVSELENKIGHILTKQALRLMEKDFKVLFMRLVGWCEEEFSDSPVFTPYHWSDLCPFRCCYERLASFLKVICILAQGLRELFLPYFSYILDWCLWVASYPTLEEYWKRMESDSIDWKIYKRKREWQSADTKQIIGNRKSLETRTITEAVEAIREYLIWSPPSDGVQSLFESILHLLENRLESNVTRIDANILASMVSLFAEKVAKQVSSTSTSDKEQHSSGKHEQIDSERRLASLNRFLLMKCREKDQQVKQVSMICVEQVVRRLGHRFLSLLPETLPLLAECLEDETIQPKALQLVEYLEDLSGEPIRKYLVK